MSGLFVDEKRLGEVRGALSLQHIGWSMCAGSRMPAIVVGFVSYGVGCSQLTACAATIADSPVGAAGSWEVQVVEVSEAAEAGDRDKS